MANTKITELTQLTNPVSTDVLPIVDVGADVTRKISIADLLKNAAVGTAEAPGIAFDGRSRNGIYSPGADQVAISTNGTGRLFVDASGRVGVNTATPERSLGIFSATNDDGVQLRNTSTAASTNKNIQIQFSGTDTIGAVKSTGNIYCYPADQDFVGAHLSFWTRGSDVNSEKMRLTSDGRLGLGTTSPSSLLHVAGTARIGAENTSDAELQIGVGATGNRSAYIDLVGDTTYTDYGLRIIRDGGANSFSRLQHRGTGSLVLETGEAGSAIVFQQQPGERARIDSSGRLGLGTSSPSYTLDIAGTNARLKNASGSVEFVLSRNASSAGATISLNTGDTNKWFFGLRGLVDDKLHFYNNVAGNTALVIDESSRVGIGTASPNGTLDINNGAAVFSNSGTYIGGIGRANGLIGGTTSELAITTSAAQGLLFGINNTERARIDSSGRLGLGTSAPDERLVVAGAIRATSNATDWSASDGALIDYNAGEMRIVAARNGANNSNMSFTTFNAGTASTRMYITSAGAVGIGTTNPGAKLTVTGTDALVAAFGRTGTTGSLIALTDSVSSAGIGCSSGALTFGANGYDTERARIDSSGRLGLGTSSPGAQLDVYNSQASGISEVARLRWNNGGTGGALTFANQSGTVLGQVANVTSGSGVELAFSTYNNSTALGERMRIDASGNVGIGTTSPGYALTVSDGTRAGFIQPSSGLGSVNFGVATNHPMVLVTNDQERARIDSSGRLLVGTSSYSGNSRFVVAGLVGGDVGLLDLRYTGSRPTGADVTVSEIRFGSADLTANSAYARIIAESDGASSSASDIPGRLVFSTTADGASSPTERMRIDNAGVFYVGCTGLTNDAPNTAGGILKQTNGNTKIRVTLDGAVAFQFYSPTGGTGASVGDITVNASSTAFNTSSDYRLKENVVPLTGAADRVNQLQVHRFNFIADPDKTVDGFIAHEAQAVVPECVTGTKDAVDADGNPVYQGIDQSKLVPLLTAALQEALAEIESLKARLTAAGI